MRQIRYTGMLYHRTGVVSLFGWDLNGAWVCWSDRWRECFTYDHEGD